MAVTDVLSSAVESVGRSFGLPEWGISERIASASATPTQGSTAPLDYSAPINQSLAQDYQTRQSAVGTQQSVEPLAATQQFIDQNPGTLTQSPQGQTTSAPAADNSGTGQFPGVDLSNPAKKTDYALSQGFDSWDQLLASLNAQQGPTQDEINAAFNPVLDVYNQAETTLRGQQPGLIQEAEAQAAASKGLLSGQRQSANELLGQQQAQTESQRARQIAQQRQILQELGQANQARFGGASSAGQAASELQGREFQRSRFGIQENAQQALQAIGIQKQQVEREYQQGLQQVEVNRQQAINEVNRRFQDKLLEINARRGETEAAKAQARMSALQELRNQAFQINVAKAQFENDLRLQAQADAAQLAQLEAQYGNYTSAGQAAYNQSTGFTPSGISSVQTGGTQVGPQYTGQISGFRPEDLYGQIGAIPGSSETDPRFANFVPNQSVAR